MVEVSGRLSYKLSLIRRMGRVKKKRFLTAQADRFAGAKR
jgi:hypothetical protein